MEHSRSQRHVPRSNTPLHYRVEDAGLEATMSDCLNTYQAAVIGASGYTGGELIRLLATHPHVTVSRVVGHQSSGMCLGEIHPGLRGSGKWRALAQLPILSFERDFMPWIQTLEGSFGKKILGSDLSSVFETTSHLPEENSFSRLSNLFSGIDIFFFALPHGESARVLPGLVSSFEKMGHHYPKKIGKKNPKVPLIFDLSGDFRLFDSEVHRGVYGFEAPDRQIQKKFTYGSPELLRDEIEEGRYFALPGCFATACNLGLAPLAQAGLLEGKWVLDCTTGSSGAGQRLGRSTHHPERDENLFAYKPFSHQHLPEIDQVQKRLSALAPNEDKKDYRIVFQAHSGPFVRGIYGTFHGVIGKKGGPNASDRDRSHERHTEEKWNIRGIFADFYSKAPMVRLLGNPPELRQVRGTNFVDIYVHQQEEDLLVCVALDNLVKGAAGQAVQVMNLALGMDEDCGLTQPPLIV